MIVGIMQPYFFPYIGYFQLINAVDAFVFYDDVQYIIRGWVNRNRVLVNCSDAWLTMPVTKASRELRINQREYSFDKKTIDTMLRQIKGAYGRAPFFQESYELVEGLLSFEDRNVARFNENSVVVISDYLGINVRFVTSSELAKDESLSGQEKIINICQVMGAKKYINPIGGVSLYDGDAFEKANLELCFIKSRLVEYRQFDCSFVPFLSIIDCLMFRGKFGVINMLSEFDLVGTK